jgi:hypothetical protein
MNEVCEDGKEGGLSESVWEKKGKSKNKKAKKDWTGQRAVARERSEREGWTDREGEAGAELRELK